MKEDNDWDTQASHLLICVVWLITSKRTSRGMPGVLTDRIIRAQMGWLEAVSEKT